MNVHFESFERNILPKLGLFDTEKLLIQAQLARNVPVHNRFEFVLPENTLLSAQFFQECLAFIQLAQDYEDFPPYSYEEFQELAKILRSWCLSVTIALWNPHFPLSTNERLISYQPFVTNDTQLRTFLEDPFSVKK